MIHVNSIVLIIFGLWRILLMDMVEGIVGGHVVESPKYGYTVSIRLNGVHICGGGIIGGRLILTAAHCVMEADTFITGDLMIVAGVKNAREIGPDAITREVQEIVVPAAFSPIIRYTPDSAHTSTGDIAVLKLNENLGLCYRFSLRALNLPNMSLKPDEYENKDVVMSGFGVSGVRVVARPVTNEPTIVYERDGYLRYADAITMTNRDCQIIAERVAKRTINIYPRSMCAKIRQGDKEHQGVCNGDSGGPLVINDNTIIGVLKWSSDACSDNIMPGVYVRVAGYMNFIKNAINGVRRYDLRLGRRKTARKLSTQPPFYITEISYVEES